MGIQGKTLRDSNQMRIDVGNERGTETRNGQPLEN